MTITERHTAISKLLDARVSELNSIFKAHEEDLQAMMVPQDTFVMYRICVTNDPNSGQPQGKCQTYLGMITFGGTWRLCHGTQRVLSDGTESEIRWQPIVDADLDDRIRAAEIVGGLRDVVITAKEEQIAEVEDAIEVSEASLYGLDQVDDTDNTQHIAVM